MNRTLTALLCLLAVQLLYACNRHTVRDTGYVEPVFCQVMKGHMGYPAMSIDDLLYPMQSDAGLLLHDAFATAATASRHIELWYVAKFGFEISSSQAQEISAQVLDLLHLAENTRSRHPSLMAFAIFVTTPCDAEYLLTVRFDEQGKATEYEPDSGWNPFYASHQFERKEGHYRLWTERTRLYIVVPIFSSSTFIGDLSLTYEIPLR